MPHPLTPRLHHHRVHQLRTRLDRPQKRCLGVLIHEGQLEGRREVALPIRPHVKVIQLGHPIALVTLVDEQRQWFKATRGIRARETQRSLAVCLHAIGQEGLFTVEDAFCDPRFMDNPLVRGDPNIRCYGGMPLKSVAGAALKYGGAAARSGSRRGAGTLSPCGSTFGIRLPAI